MVANSEARAATEVEVTDVDNIIYRHVMWVSVGSGIPVPLLDVVVVLGFQLRMIKELCEHYEVPFSEHRTRSILIALLSGCATEGVAKGAFVGTVLNSIPMANTLTTFLRVYLPFKLGIVVAGASTYAVGRIFAHHFADGGSLDDESAKFKKYFNQQLQVGVEKVKGWVSKPQPA